jgi:penicillin G amidase
MQLFKFLLALAVTIALAYGADHRFGTIPALGRFLDPFQGFWQNSESSDRVPPEQLAVPGLRGKVSVVYDDKLVPHVFAENDHDLYFAQGYVTAQHRLWQMEFQTHAAAGRISEILANETTLDLDRTNRRKGLVFGAQNALQSMDSLPQAREVIAAYSAGVNAYLTTLTPKSLPLEYKLLDYEPEAWSPLKTSLLLKYMANTLAASDGDLEATNALKALGRPTFDLLFPDYYPGQAPIVPTDKRWDFEPIKVAQPAGAFSPDWVQVEPVAKPDPGTGSNNWAVAGSKTASGNPILCDDPHLTLSLPSIWFEMQLSAPGVNVYGVTLPGSPAVIIGFNQSVAWGVTNAQRDVLDWYKVQFRDAQRDEYLLDGNWTKTRKVVEEIKRRGQPPVYDTVCYTQWGPVMYDANFREKSQKANYALRWVAHDPSTELMTYHLLNRAKNHQEFDKALDYFDCPAQNFVFAATNGDIAMRIQGKYPLKWKEQGKFLMDGTRSANGWQGFIPDAHNVQVLNPARGYVSSANQHPADTLYPYYVRASGYEYYRNRRINGLLDSMRGIRPADMMRMQNDNFNLQAAESLPYFLAQIDETKLTPEQKRAFDLLRGWDYFNHAESEAASYHEAWWDKLYPLVWDEMESPDRPMSYPKEGITIALMRKTPNFPLFDNRATPEKETAKDLIVKSFAQAVDSVANWQVKNNQKGAQWADYKATSIAHLVPLLKPFGVHQVRNGGNHGIVNATSSRNGPSWRMVVELDKNGVKGWGVYPGGQSGNPGSPHYADMIDRWRDGQHYELLFLKSPTEKNGRIKYAQELAGQ